MLQASLLFHIQVQTTLHIVLILLKVRNCDYTLYIISDHFPLSLHSVASPKVIKMPCMADQTSSFPPSVVFHSQSVPSSPSIQQRVTEPLASTASLQQQFSNGHCSTTPTPNTATGAGNFTFDNISLTTTSTHIPPCDLNSGNFLNIHIHSYIMDPVFDIGTSQEARDEKEKTEAFSRLHQGKK